MKRILVLLLMIGLISLVFAKKEKKKIKPYNISGLVTKIIDGDTIKILTTNGLRTVRLYGINCTEIKEPFSKKAEAFTYLAIFGKQVRVRIVDKGPFKRDVGIVYYGDKKLNAELLAAGYAWVDNKYCKDKICEDWRKIQAEAIKEKRGIWKIFE